MSARAVMPACPRGDSGGCPAVHSAHQHLTGRLGALGQRAGGASVALLIHLALIGAGLLLLTLIVLDLSHIVRTRGRRLRRLEDQALAEERARWMMSELCTGGWQARITLHEGPEEAPSDRPAGPRGRVLLEWSELDPETGEEAMLRRVWAPSVSAALEAMVADRQTDETLEQIERAAAADGILWPDLQ